MVNLKLDYCDYYLNSMIKISVGHEFMLFFLASCAFALFIKSFIYSLYNINGFYPVKLQIVRKAEIRYIQMFQLRTTIW